MENGPKGILVVDKPAGWTSHDVVARTRSLLRVKKVGHTGTLDPMATGVLVLLVGTATKEAKRFENDDKRYAAEVTFGFSTDTHDATGRPDDRGDASAVDIEKLKETVTALIGTSEQYPPMYSAVKVGGKKLYQLARKGKTIERKARIITIHDIHGDFSGFPVVILDIVCSKGTYIRSLAHELGESVGCPAHLSALRRTASGSFRIEDAIDFLAVSKHGDAETLRSSVFDIPAGGEA